MAAPYVPRYSPSDLEEAKVLLKIDNPSKVEQAYRAGQLTLQKKIALQKRYNELQREIDIQGGAAGEIRDYVERLAKEWTPMWEAAKKIPGAIGGQEKFDKAVMETAFHGVMLGLAALSAQDIPGNVVERWAGAAGAPPGLARLFNWLVWIPTNFFSTSTLLKPVNAGIGLALNLERIGMGAVKGRVFSVGEGARNLYEYLKDPVAWAVKNSLALDSPEIKAAVGQIGEAVARQAKTTNVEAMTEALRAGENPQALTDQILQAGEDFLQGIIPQGTGATPEQAAARGEEMMRRGREFLQTPQQLQQEGIDAIMRYYAERAKAFIRKGVSHGQTAEQSKAADIVEILHRGPGQPLSAAETHLVGKTFDEVSKGFDESLKQAMPELESIATGNRPDLRAAYEAHLLAMGEVNPIFLGGTGELGRGLEYLKTLQPELRAARMYDNIFRELGSEFLHQGNDAAISAAIGRLALMAKEGRETLIKEAAKEHAPGVLHRFFKHLIFANPATHIVNILGSKLSILMNAAERTGSSFVIGGPPIRESAANWAGLASGFRNYPRIIRQAVERTTEGVEKAGISVPVGKYTPAGMLGLEDDIMTAWTEVGLTRAAAMKKVLNAGIEGKAAQKVAVDAMLNDPIQYSKLVEEVGPEAQHIMFHDPLSAAGEMVATAIRSSKFDYVMPVVKFPINSLKMARDWTPGLQYLSTRTADALIAGGEAEARFRARQTMSWMLANVIWDAALEEKIGWGGPRDPNAHRAWVNNNTEYHLGGLPMRWAEPFATPVFAISDMAHLWNQMRPDNVNDFAAAISLTFERAIGNNYWLRIMEGITNAISGMGDARKPEEWMLALGKVALQPAMTLATGGIVGSPVGRRFRELFDPEVKDVRDLTEYFIAQVPGYSKTIPPRLNYSAKPIKVPPTIGGRWLSFLLPPLRPKAGDEDPVGAFLTKHDLKLPDNWKTYGGYDPERPLRDPTTADVGVPLNGQQTYNWKLFSLDGVMVDGKTWVQRIAELDADPEFAARKLSSKQEKVSLLYNRYRNAGWKALKQEDPQIAQMEEQAKQFTKANRGRLTLNLEPKVPLTDVPDATTQDLTPQQEEQALGVEQPTPEMPPTEEAQ